jgi:hypothetical protein
MSNPSTKSMRTKITAVAAIVVAAAALASCSSSPKTSSSTTTPGFSAACSTAVDGVKQFISKHPGNAGPITGSTVQAYQTAYKQVLKSCPPKEITKLTQETIQPWIRSIHTPAAPTTTKP